MKAQEDSIDFDLKNKDSQLSKDEEDYYKGREHLFSPKAQKRQSGGFFVRNKKLLIISGLLVFILVPVFSDNSFAESLGLSLLLMIVVIGFIKFNELLDTNPVNESEIEGDDLVGRSISANTVDKMFTDD